MQIQAGTNPTTTLQELGTNREGKGKSSSSFPENYVVIDIETTGYSPRYDEIIELCAIKYHHGSEEGKYHTLVKPKRTIDEYITELTGISNEMVADAPEIEACIEQFKNFIGDEIIIGYNVNFDINFLYDALYEYHGKFLNNDYVDVLRIARRALPDLDSHRQIDVANHYGISVLTTHRSEADCVVCQECYKALKNEILAKWGSLSDFTVRHTKHSAKITAKDISAKVQDFDETHPIYGKVCVFTGTLDQMARKEAMQLVADLGGIPADSVTKKTNYLILGNLDYCKTIRDGKSSKQKKAEKLILAGAELKIIPEQVFYDLLLSESGQ